MFESHHRLVLALTGVLAFRTIDTPAAEFFVAPHGNDTSAGTHAAPFATPARASEAARDSRHANPNEAVTVTLQAGTYRLDKTLIFGSADSGVRWRAAAGEEVVLSGGHPIQGWREVTINGRTVWQADLDAAMLQKGLRDFYVNGQRRPRARSTARVPAGMLRNAKGEPQGIVLDDPAVARYARPQDLQVRQQVSWRHYILSVESAEPGEAGQTCLRLRDTPEWLSPAFVGFKSYAPVILENALELLDEPGEWYFDRVAGKLDYLPRPGETPASIKAIVPVLERLVEIKGANDLSFEGITFAYAGWHSPSEEGWFGYDPGHIIKGQGGAGGLSFANVYATDSQALRFHRNTFTRLGGVGLHLHQVNDAQVIGNVFEDISADGLGLGAVRDPDLAPERLVVANNLFQRVCQDYAMGAAILTGKLLDANIHHNHVRDVPYIGILVNKLFGNAPKRYGQVSVRWNLVEEVMKPTFDGGSFYTWMDGSSDGAPCVFSDNYLRGVFSRDSQGIYLDNDCRYWLVERNVIEGARDRWYLIKGSQHTLRDNFTDNDNCRRQDLHTPDNIVEERTVVDPTANWATHPLAKATVKNGGLEPAYRDLLTRLPPRGGKNHAPLVSVAPAGKVTLLENARLRGTARDDDLPYGVTRFEWTKISGPGEVTFYGQQTRALELSVAFSLPGDYVLRLTVTDLAVESHADVSITVSPADKGAELTASLPDSAWTASATNTPGESPAKAHDKDLGSFWYPGFPGIGWLQVDLGAPKAISRVELALRQDSDHKESRSEFEMLASNDPQFASYVTVAEQGLDPDPQSGRTWSANFPQNGTTYRYVRYWKRNGFDGVVPELRIFAQP